jgi:hypothetical protein
MLLPHDRGDMIIGVVLMLFCALMLYVVIPAEVPVRVDVAKISLSPRFFPKFSVACIMIFSAALALHATFFRPRHSPKQTAHRKERHELLESQFNVGKVIALIAAFIILMNITGALIAIPIFLVAFMLFVGMKSRLKILMLACGTVAVVYFFFERLLYVILPEGLLF